MRSNKRGGEKPSHVVSAWSKEDGFCLGQKAAEEKLERLKKYCNGEKSIEKEGKKTVEYRCFISSLRSDIEQVSQAVRGHWSIESMHWHLDVTFR